MKKVSNKEFRNLYKEYDDYFDKRFFRYQTNRITDDEYISILIDFFNFEDKISLEFVYAVSDYAVKNNISDEAFDRVKYLYASPLRIAKVACMNRSFFLRDKYIPLIINGDKEEFQKHLGQYLTDIWIVYFLKNELITDDMIESIPRSEWVDYLEDYYNLTFLFNNKAWESKKIRIARKIFGQWSGQGVIEE